MRFQILNVKIYNGPLIATFSVLFQDAWPGGLIVHNFSYRQSKEGRKFITFPQKVYEKDGEKKYFSEINFPDKTAWSQFCVFLVERIEAFIMEYSDPIF